MSWLCWCWLSCLILTVLVLTVRVLWAGNTTSKKHRKNYDFTSFTSFTSFNTKIDITYFLSRFVLAYYFSIFLCGRSLGSPDPGLRWLLDGTPHRRFCFSPAGRTVPRRDRLSWRGEVKVMSRRASSRARELANCPKNSKKNNYSLRFSSFFTSNCQNWAFSSGKSNSWRPTVSFPSWNGLESWSWVKTSENCSFY